jgi:Spy/CpxP family protein refolding chaperone
LSEDEKQKIKKIHQEKSSAEKLKKKQRMTEYNEIGYNISLLGK